MTRALGEPSDPLLAFSFNALHGWFARGEDKCRTWNETPEISTTYHELRDLNHWWTVLRPSRAPARCIDEMVAYHRIDSDQLIRLAKVREFLVHPNIQSPIYPLARVPEMALVQFRTEDLALEVCRRGTVAGAVVVSQDHSTGPDRYDVDYYAKGDTPLNKIRTCDKLLKYVTALAETEGCSAQEIDRALGIPDHDDEDDWSF